MSLLPKNSTILLFFGFLLSQNMVSCTGDDDGGTDSDDTDTGSETGTGTEEPGCEDIEWGEETTYLVNGGTVANWQQTAFFDADDSGMIDKEERVDVDINFMGICEREKESLVVLIATDN